MATSSRSKFKARKASKEVMHDLVCQKCVPKIQKHKRLEFGEYQCTKCGSKYQKFSEVRNNS